MTTVTMSELMERINRELEDDYAATAGLEVVCRACGKKLDEPTLELNPRPRLNGRACTS